MVTKGKEKFKTRHNVFDEFTNRNLFKLISQGYFDGLVGPIKIGKEANVFLALKGKKKIVVKIYRLETSNFNTMYTYIKSDPRFVNLKNKRRKVIFAWTQREFRNLIKSREAGVKVPVPINVKDNILIEEFIGDESPAPQLKDLHPKDPKKFLNEIVKNIRSLYKAGLVHADLSSFNILNHNEKPVLIDFSQTTTLKDFHAQEYLERDIKNVVNFFRKLGVDTSKEEILNKVKT